MSASTPLFSLNLRIARLPVDGVAVFSFDRIVAVFVQKGQLLPDTFFVNSCLAIALTYKPAPPVISAERFGYPIRIYFYAPIGNHAKLQGRIFQSRNRIAQFLRGTLCPIQKNIYAHQRFLLVDFAAGSNVDRLRRGSLTDGFEMDGSLTQPFDDRIGKTLGTYPLLAHAFLINVARVDAILDGFEPGIVHGSGPVSYTHLDVYKRQP